jgi:hypothetical protein
MLTLGRISLPAAAAALALGLPSAPVRAGEAEPFVTSQGLRVFLSPVVDMSCGELLAKLEEIDATGYRGLRPTPRDSRDARLLDYETDVSRRYYSRCARRGETRDGSYMPWQGLAAAPADDE